jgi:tRNA dimethylallyltransferase
LQESTGAFLLNSGATSEALPPAIVLLGPTASGKSGLALKLAQRFPLEIVSVDSAQVYQFMDRGTAKPSPGERAQVPHHLVDLLLPTERYSAARFCQDALACMADITARGRIPFLTGGTMLYYKALTSGLAPLPSADPDIRSALANAAAKDGWPSLHRQLARVDPQTAARLEPNDAQRIQRALEVFRITGSPLSRLLEESPPPRLPYRIIGCALIPSERKILHERIATRFAAMLDAGLIGEVELLRRTFVLNPDLPSMRCVGYRQVWQFLDGEFDAATLNQKGVAATRQLAKRQLTWLRSFEDLREFDCLAGDLSQSMQDWIARALYG